MPGITTEVLAMEVEKRRVALVAHESQLGALLDWALFNRDLLAQHEVYATGVAVEVLAEMLAIKVIRFRGGSNKRSWPTELESKERPFDLLVLFWNCDYPPSDDPDLKALLRLVQLGKVPIAGNRTAAYLMFPCYLYEQFDY